jgi:NADPH2:quinone reductase
MKAILCSQYCGPTISCWPVPDPVAEAGEAVIAIKSAALNFFDLLMIRANTRSSRRFRFAGGGVAGVIESVGAGVTDLKVATAWWRPALQRRARKIALPANSIVKFRQSGFRSCRRHHHHLRHRAACAGRSPPA